MIGTYYKPTVDIHEIDKRIDLLECDIRYPDNIYKIIEKYKPDTVYHLAAQSYPAVSWEHPYETIEINSFGTIAIFEAIKRIRRSDRNYDPMVIVACSSAEYGASLDHVKGKFVCEDTALLPLHPYGVSKVAQDLLSFQYFINDNIKCIRARIFNSTGTRKTNDVTSDFTRRAVECERKNCYQFKTGNLESFRAIMDQRDLINALVLLSMKGIPGEVYNISSENIYQMKDIVGMIEKKIDHKLELIVDPVLLRSSDEHVIAGNIDKLKKATGWKQQITMEQTISDMIDYWRVKLS